MKKLFSAVALLSLFIATPATAATFVSEEALFIESPISDDVYAAGGKVTIKESIRGDAIVAGGDITITSGVDQDLTIAGGKISIRGPVKDDVRIAGGEVTLNDTVGGHVVVFGGDIDIQEGARIKDDLIVFGGEITIDGTIDGDVIVKGGVVFMNGVIRGDLDFEGGELYLNGSIQGSSTVASESVELGSAARIGGDLDYWTDKDDVNFEAITAGTVTRNSDLQSEGFDAPSEAVVAGIIASLLAGVALYSVLSAALVIFLLLLGTRTYFKDGAKLAKKEPWMNALYGLLYFICTPIVAVLFMITVIGIPIGATVVAMYAISIAFAKPITAILLVFMYNSKSKKKSSIWKNGALSVLVFIVLKIVAQIPVIGWLVACFAICMTFGALMRTEYAKYLKVR
ncbi:MAG: hypothetical protein HOJ16_00815 [Candidatus Peribacter sp.]|nr:hypothetical protein [Candidatus Peribacter sp.]MBT6823121.1 hypothetical protein [Candidatus Peribacter sp.]